jgi:hypothetical protein
LRTRPAASQAAATNLSQPSQLLSGKRSSATGHSYHEGVREQWGSGTTYECYDGRTTGMTTGNYGTTTTPTNTAAAVNAPHVNLNSVDDCFPVLEATKGSFAAVSEPVSTSLPSTTRALIGAWPTASSSYAASLVSSNGITVNDSSSDEDPVKPFLATSVRGARKDAQAAQKESAKSSRAEAGQGVARRAPHVGPKTGQ